MRYPVWIFASLLLAICACKKEPISEADAFPSISPGNMMLVCAEGNFRWNNAEAGLVNLSSDEQEWNAFSKKNKRPLGDVLQSAAFWQGKLWLVVNNSGRLEGLNPSSFELQESISGLTSPRFLQAVSDEKAYVSDLYANKIWILKRGIARPAGEIPMPGWTEELLLSGNRIWVVCRQKPWVLGIDPVSDQVTDTLFLYGNGTSIAAASDGKIWIGQEGNGTGRPGIGLYHPDSSQALKYWECDPVQTFPDRFSSSLTGDTLFFLQQGLCRLQSNDGAINKYRIPGGNWYGMAWDPFRKVIIVSDVKDYQQASLIQQISYDGKLKKAWTGGIISSRFYFW
jgi:hypothetical protein